MCKINRAHDDCNKEINLGLMGANGGRRKIRRDHLKEVIFELKNENQPAIGRAEQEREHSRQGEQKCKSPKQKRTGPPCGLGQKRGGSCV